MAIRTLYGHPDVVFEQRPDGPYISLYNLTLSNGCILFTIGSIYTKLGDFVKLGLHVMTMWINTC